MALLTDAKLGRKITQLNIAYPGHGKTVAAASYPKPIKFFDLDQRIDSLIKNFPGDAGKGIEYEQYGPYDFQRFWDGIQKLKQGDNPYKTVVLDSLTALARMTINFSIDLRGKSGGRKKGLTIGNVPMMDVSDFNAESSLLAHVIAIFRATNSHFILNAHLVETKHMVGVGEDAHEEVKQRVVTAGKTIAAEIPGYFNERYYIEKKADLNGYRYFCYTVNRNGVDTQTNLPLPPEIEFTMKPGEEGLFQKIQRMCKEKGIEI